VLSKHPTVVQLELMDCIRVNGVINDFKHLDFIIGIYNGKKFLHRLVLSCYNIPQFVSMPIRITKAGVDIVITVALAYGPYDPIPLQV